ncbi:MAG TPA: hypothetical protein VJA94_10165 [Candidatus Angelobacter sp.]
MNKDLIARRNDSAYSFEFALIEVSFLNSLALLSSRASSAFAFGFAFAVAFEIENQQSEICSAVRGAGVPWINNSPSLCLLCSSVLRVLILVFPKLAFIRVYSRPNGFAFAVMHE